MLADMTRLNPYITFDGTAREAMEFYRGLLGGELQLDTFEGYVPDETPDEQKRRIMHAQLEAPSGITLMGADVPPGMPFDGGARIVISLSGPTGDDDYLRSAWSRLADGGTVLMPLEQAPWGAVFGGLVDRYGVQWYVNIGEV